jgi:hypothetical protein
MPNISDLEWIVQINKLANGVTRLTLQPGQRFPKVRQHCDTIELSMSISAQHASPKR